MCILYGPGNVLQLAHVIHSVLIKLIIKPGCCSPSNIHTITSSLVFYLVLLLYINMNYNAFNLVLIVLAA